MKPAFLLLFFFLSAMAFAREKKSILYPNGRVQYEYEMENRMFDGRFSSYYETGKLRMKGQFSKNQKTGLWRVWDEKGRLRSERNYADNEHFNIVAEFDSNGTKLRHVDLHATQKCDFGDYLFSHRYVSEVRVEDPENAELFSANGLVDQIFQNIKAGASVIFREDKFVEPVSAASLSPRNYTDITGLVIKEEYYYCSVDQTMHNKILGICPIVMEKGLKKELGWLYVPDIIFGKEAIEKIRTHEYVSTITKTTANDPAFKLKDVSAKENDLLRLMLVEFEGNAILYMIDKQLLAGL